MNARSHKLIFSKKLGALIAVGEHTTSGGKTANGASTPVYAVRRPFGVRLLYIACLICLGAPPRGFAAPPINTLPLGATIQTGQVSISSQGANLAIAQSSASASVNWTSFSIGSGASVQIVQPSASATLLNRVTGTDPSQIFGKLSANGQVFLINPNGIVFGASGLVTASAFTASTFGLSDDDFLRGNFRFQRNGSNAQVRVESGARIDTSAQSNGYVALIATQVSNSGHISTQGGQVVLAAGENVSFPKNLAVPLSRRVSLEITPANVSTAIANNANAIIQTQGGEVLMQASSLVDVVAGVSSHVQQLGVIDTSAAQAGKVTLLANLGNIDVHGRITADSTTRGQAGADIVIGRDTATGELAASTDVRYAQLQSTQGLIETSAQVLHTQGVSVRAREWLLDPTDVLITNASAAQPASNITTTVITDSTINAQLNNGTSVTVQTNNSAGASTGGNITVSGRLGQTAGSSSAQLTLDAYRDITLNTDIGNNGGTGALNLIGIAGGNISVVGNLNTNLGAVSLTAGSASRANVSGAGIALQNVTASSLTTTSSGYTRLNGNIVTGTSSAAGAQRYNSDLQVTNNVTLSSNGGSVTVVGNISSPNTTSSLTVNAGAGQVTLGASGRTISGLSSLAVSSTNTINAIASTISGNTALSFNGLKTGVLTLTANNTYSGTTTLTDGTLQVGNGNAANNSRLGSGTIYIDGSTSLLSFYTGNTVVLNQSLIGNGAISSSEDLQFNGAIQLNASSAINNFLNIQTQASSASATNGNIYVGGGITNTSSTNASLNITANNGLFLNSAISSPNATTQVALTANGLTNGIAANMMNATQLAASRGLVLSSRGDIATNGGTLTLTGHSNQTVSNSATDGIAVHISALGTVNASGVLSGTASSDLQISASSVNITGVSSTGTGVRMNSANAVSNITSTGDVNISAKGTNGFVSDFSNTTSGNPNLIQAAGTITLDAESTASTGVGISAAGLSLRGAGGISLTAKVASNAQTAIELISAAGRNYALQSVDSSNNASGNISLLAQGGRINVANSNAPVLGTNITIDNTYNPNLANGSLNTFGSTNTAGAAVTLANNVTATNNLTIRGRQNATSTPQSGQEGILLTAFLSAAKMQVTGLNDTANGVGLHIGGNSAGAIITPNANTSNVTTSFLQGTSFYSGAANNAATRIDSTNGSFTVGSGAKLRIMGTTSGMAASNFNNTAGIGLYGNITSSGDLTFQGSSSSFNGILASGTITHSAGDLALMGLDTAAPPNGASGSVYGAGITLSKDINVSNGNLTITGSNAIKNTVDTGNGVLMQSAANINVTHGSTTITGYSTTGSLNKAVTLQGNVTSDGAVNIIGQSDSTSSRDTLALLGNITTTGQVNIQSLGGLINISTINGNTPSSINAGSLVIDNTGAGRTALFADSNAGWSANASVGGSIAANGSIAMGSGMARATGGVLLQNVALNVTGNVNIAGVTHNANARGVFLNTAIQASNGANVNVLGQNSGIGSSNVADGVSIDASGWISNAGGTVNIVGNSSVAGSSGVRAVTTGNNGQAIRADQINVTGTSSATSGNGVLISATLTTTNNSGKNLSSTIQGTSAGESASNSGIDIEGNSILTASAGTQINVNGQASSVNAATSTGSAGISIANNARVGSSGNVNLNGSSSNASGFVMKSGASWTHTGSSSTLNIVGSTSTSYAGVSLEANTNLNVASNLQVSGDNTNAAQAASAHGVIVAGNITNSVGSTTLHASTSGIQLQPTASIQHLSTAGAILITAGDGTSTSAASLRLSDVGTTLASASSVGTQIVQASNAGVTLTTDGTGDLTVAKINNLGSGNVVVGAGIQNTAGTLGGNIKTVAGYNVSNANGKTYFYSGTVSNTDSLANLNSALGNLNLDNSSSYTQNTAVNTVYNASSLGIGTSASTQVAFRGTANFANMLNGATLAQTYGDANTFSSAAAQSNLATSLKTNLAAQSQTQLSVASNAGNLNIQGASLVSDAVVSLQNAAYSSANYLNANTYTANVSGSQYITSLKTGQIAQVQVGTKAITSSGIAVADKVYDGTASVAANTINTAQAVLNGTLTGDKLSLDISKVQASFGSANVAYSGGNVAAQNISLTGVQVTGKDASNYTITDASNASAKITPKAITTATISAVNTAVYGALTATGNVALGSDVLATDLPKVGAANAAQIVSTTSDLSNSGNLKAGSYKQQVASGLSGSAAGNYSFAGTTSTSANYTVNKKDITSASIGAVTSAVYATATATGAVSLGADVLGNDRVSASNSAQIVATTADLSTSGNLKAGSYKQQVAAGLKDADASNYNFAGTTTASANYTVNKLNLATTGLSASDKTYDATTNAALNVSTNTLAGTQSGNGKTDIVSYQKSSMKASFDTANVAYDSNNQVTSKTVNITGIALTGQDASNYTTASSASVSATITPKAITTASIADVATVYSKPAAAGVVSLGADVFASDANTVQANAAQIVSGASDLSTSGNLKAGSYFQKVGAGLTGSAKGNYSFAGKTSTTANYKVSKLAMALTGIKANDKVYDGTSETTFTITAMQIMDIQSGSNKTDDVQFADTDLHSGTLHASFDNAKVAYNSNNQVIAKNVNITGLSLIGTDAANYTSESTTGVLATITPKPISVSYSVKDKVFDNTSLAKVDPQLSGVVGSDAVSASHASATFDSSAIGNAKKVTISDVQLVGVDKGNYQLQSNGTTPIVAYATGNILADSSSNAWVHFSNDAKYLAALNPISKPITPNVIALKVTPPQAPKTTQSDIPFRLDSSITHPLCGADDSSTCLCDEVPNASGISICYSPEFSLTGVGE